MNQLRNVTAIAHLLVREMGEAGHVVIEQRAHEHEREGDAKAAALWSRVASAMKALRPSSTRPASRAPRPIAPRLPAAAVRCTFDQTPHAYLLLSPDLIIADANYAYLSATLTRRDEILGCPMFDVFPDNPDLSDPDGERNLARSFANVLSTLKPNRMARQRYDVRNQDGEFEERWWEPLNSPVFDDDGRFSLILHHVQDVTREVRAHALTA